jgi:hypothetical protein
MANFQDSRFLGISPRALGLGVVAVGIVVGLFFIPETVRFLFDAKPRATKEKAQPVKQQLARKPKAVDESKAALAPEALTELNLGMQKAGEPRKDTLSKASPNGAKAPRKAGDADEGIFSGWNFQVKANPGGPGNVEIPSSLTFDRLISREGASFFKKGRVAIRPFLQREGFLGTVAEDSVATLLGTIDMVASSGAGKAAGSAEELGNRLKTDHVNALRGLKAAGADRGVMMRWLRLPVIEFIDKAGNVGATRRVRASFAPLVQLTELAVQQGAGSSCLGMRRGGDVYRAQFTVFSSDVERVAVYSNGRLIKTFRLSGSSNRRERSFRIGGNPSGVTTLIAYDSFGAKPFSKNYAFYPRVQAFRQDARGVYQIGFLPGSAEDSLDRYFFVGGTSRARTSDPMISQF